MTNNEMKSTFLTATGKALHTRMTSAGMEIIAEAAGGLWHHVLLPIDDSAHEYALRGLAEFAGLKWDDKTWGQE